MCLFFFPSRDFSPLHFETVSESFSKAGQLLGLCRKASGGSGWSRHGTQARSPMPVRQSGPLVASQGPQVSWHLGSELSPPHSPPSPELGGLSSSHSKVFLSHLSGTSLFQGTALKLLPGAKGSSPGTPDHHGVLKARHLHKTR